MLLTAFYFLILQLRIPRSSTLFPYTTLFRSVGEAMFGEAKVRAVRQIAAELNLDLGRCYAYGDSAHDRCHHRRSIDRKSTRLNSTNLVCRLLLEKKKRRHPTHALPGTQLHAN